MRHSLHHPSDRPDLEGLDPVAMFVIPLGILLLSLIAIRAIIAAAVV
jgi:hypothetical protein